MREVVLEEAPEDVESFFKGYAAFNRGALLPDPNGALSGTGKMIRHITFRKENDVNRPSISPGSHRAGKPTRARRARYAHGRNQPQTAFKTTLTTR